MYKVTYKGNLKPVFNHAVVDSGDGWFLVDPMRYERYAAKVEQKREKRRQAHEKQVQDSKRRLVGTKPPQRKTRTSKVTMHSRQKLMQANIMADAADTGFPITGELIQPLRGREWQSEFLVPLVQAGVTGIIVMAGTGIALAISYELLDNVRAGIVEFSVIGAGAWLFRAIQYTRRYSFVDALVEALPFGAVAAAGAGGYYLIVTGHWFTAGWGAAISGIAGFAALAFQWVKFLGKADDLLYAIERVVNADIDGDGYEGEPPIEPAGVRAIPFNRGEETGAVEVDNALPVDSHVWQAFAVAVLAHKCTISKTAVTKLTSEKGWKWRKISQPAYGAIYRYCEKNRYIETDSTTGSNTLSVKGWEELSRWLPQNISPNLPHPTQKAN